MLDKVGNREERRENSAIKFVAPRTALWVIDQAVHVHDGAGASNDVPLARM